LAQIDTVYRIVNEYQIKDKGTVSGARRIGKELDRTSRKGMSLKKVLLGVGLAFSARAAFGFAKRNLIDFNSNLEQTKIKAATLLSINVGGTFAKQMGAANDIVGQLQERAAKSTATTAEMADFFGRVVGPATRAGLAVKDLAGFTAKSVIAAKVFGEEATAALDIKQALSSQVTIKDRFANQLLNIVNIEKDAFNKLGKPDRLKILVKALNDPALAKAAQAQGQSAAGVFSTLKDNIQIALGKVGLPLMKELVASAKELVGFLSSPSGLKEVAEVSRTISRALVTGFKFVKTVVSFIVRHRKMFMLIAKGFLAFKATKGLTGAAGGLAEFMHSMDRGGVKMAVLSGKVGNVAGKFGKLVSKLGVAGLALGAFVIALKAIADWFDKRQDDGISEDVENESTRRGIGRAIDAGKGGNVDVAFREFNDLVEKGLIVNGKVNSQAFRDQFGLTGFNEPLQDAKKVVALREIAVSKRFADASEKVNLALKLLHAPIQTVRDTDAKTSARDAANAAISLREAAMRNPRTAKSFADSEEVRRQEEVFLEENFKKSLNGSVNVKIEIPARDPDIFARQFNDAMEQITGRPTEAGLILGNAF
jgi:hypothetical protein